jgi:hypothetical protein
VANQRPNAVRRAALELLGRGLSERQVQEALKARGITCSRGSLQNWRKGEESAGSAPKRTPRAPEPTPAPAAQASGTAVGAEPLSAVAPELELSEEELLHLPAQQLGQILIRVRERVVQEAGSSTLDHTVLGALMQVTERLTKALVLARPPTRIDPEKDPASLEARAAVLEKISRLVAKERAAAVAPQGA